MSIFTVSNFSKSELIKILKIKENKIIVTSSAACITDHQDDKILDKIRVKKEKYFLMVGSLDIKKNIIKAVEAFGQLQDRDTDLVIVGGDNRSVFSGLIIPNMENIKFTGYIRDEELSSLYKNAIAFVYPSLYEGFGIPPLEAMSLNCPVIVSNSGPLPEVCGDAALYCQPECVASITNAMRNLLKIPHLRYELIGKGKIQVTKFSFVKSSKILLKKLLNDLECS